jgi:hypothetical protein
LDFIAALLKYLETVEMCLHIGLKRAKLGDYRICGMFQVMDHHVEEYLVSPDLFLENINLSA